MLGIAGSSGFVQLASVAGCGDAVGSERAGVHQCSANLTAPPALRQPSL